MKYKLIMTAAIALTAVIVASVGLAVATDAPWDRLREQEREGIQQQDQDQISRPEDAGSAAAAQAAVACEGAVQMRSQERNGTPGRSRAASGTPAAREMLGLARAQERAADEAQQVLARVRERVEAHKADESQGTTTRERERTRTSAGQVPPAIAQTGSDSANGSADCPDPGANCPNPDGDCDGECPDDCDGDQTRQQTRTGGGRGQGS